MIQPPDRGPGPVCWWQSASSGTCVTSHATQPHLDLLYQHIPEHMKLIMMMIMMRMILTLQMKPEMTWQKHIWTYSHQLRVSDKTEAVVDVFVQPAEDDVY